MSKGAFISSKVTLEIKNKDDDIFKIPNNYVGYVPEWVMENWLFKACCQDGTITFLGKNKELQEDYYESKELEEIYVKAEKLGIKVTKNMKPETILKRIEETEKIKESHDSEQP